MLSDKTRAYGEQLATALLRVDALYRAEGGTREALSWNCQDHVRPCIGKTGQVCLSDCSEGRENEHS